MKLRGLLTTQQAAARLQICISALRRMVYSGKLPEIRLSPRCIVYRKADVRKLEARAGRGRPRKKGFWK